MKFDIIVYKKCEALMQCNIYIYGSNTSIHNLAFSLSENYTTMIKNLQILKKNIYFNSPFKIAKCQYNHINKYKSAFVYVLQVRSDR